MTPSPAVRVSIVLFLLGVFIYELRSGKVYDKLLGLKTRERNPRQYWFWIDVHAVFIVLLILFWVLDRT